MDKCNGHDPNLVNLINMAWDENKEKFSNILCALYRRDIDEITDSDAFQYDVWLSTPEYKHGVKTGDWAPYNSMALSYMENNWDNEAYNYLMHIADDCDIECVLGFIRYKTNAV